MTQAARELAVKWRTLFKQGEKLVDAGEFKQALSIFGEALTVMRSLEAEGSTKSGGPDDLRSSETIERIGFCHEQLGNTEEAEKQHSEVLRITKGRLVGMMTTQGSVRGLIRIYAAAGRDDEIETLKAEYPFVTEEDPPSGEISEYHPEFGFMLTLSGLFRDGGKTYPLLEIAEEFIAHTEICLGTDHELSLHVMRETGKLFHTGHREKAAEIFTRALKIALAKEGDNLEDISKCMRDLASCNPESPLGKALSAKARAIEMETGKEDIMDKTMRMVMAMTGTTPPPDMVMEEADRILDQWRAEQTEDAVPFVAMELTRKQRFNQLLGLAKRVVAWDEAEGVEQDYPLSRIGALGMVAECYKEIGDIENARLYFEREMEVTAKHWGDGHALVTDVLAKIEELDELQG